MAAPWSEGSFSAIRFISQVTMPSIVGQASMYNKHYMLKLEIKNIRTGKK